MDAECNNTLWETIENVGFHLVRNGMIETYNIWNIYGEQLDNASSSNATRVDKVEPIVDPNEQVMDIINDVFPFALTNINQEGEDDVPIPMASAEFAQLLKNANQELYPGCESFSVLMTIVELMHGNIKHHMSNIRRCDAASCSWGGMKDLDRMFPEFAADPRNVRLGLATEGFNPYGVLNQHHITWQIFVFPYNLPPWKCMKKEHMMMTVLVTEDPGRSIDVYLRLLVDKLKDLWTNEWRKKDQEFDGNTEHRLIPREWFGDEILEQLNRLDFALFGKTVSRTRPSTHMNWTHKPMFFELPYWLKLKLRHNLDVKHVEKNVFDTLVGTILDIEGKTKDTIKARLDLERMGIRRVSRWYASNIACCVNVDGGKFAGLKSHDCHIFFPTDGKNVRKTDINPLRHNIVQVICKFEMIFPPAFFTSMIHVMVHLPEEALLLGELKKSVRNRAKPEGSIIEVWVQYELLSLCGMYLKDMETTFNRPQRNNDKGLRNEKLSVFAQSARPFRDFVRGESFSRNDMEVAHWFVLNNCDEIMAYLDEHEEMMKREHPSHLYAKKHHELFPQWFLDYLISSNSPTYSAELYTLGFGLISAKWFSGCHVNSFKFLGTARDDKLCMQNSGVHVSNGGKITDIDFYGKLTTVVQLLYKDRYQVIMFKCRWFDTNPNRQGSVKIDYGLLSVNINRTWYDDDPYILTNMAKQIVYLDALKPRTVGKLFSRWIRGTCMLYQN
ncbi:hypothetical protein Prudu_115S000500 [Prunus dulcis]|uniref:Transposable element protein n=1 Tax=Prunus dulcis TaxID=3755 RepID=A0A5H2XGC7_PRUDU|nr:hypothetical protein Prudu_115S000500 [Prunus dulcis]